MAAIEIGRKSAPKRLVIIADAGPLIVLSRIGQLSLLRRVYGEVWITETVHAEIIGGRNKIRFLGQDDLILALSQWLHVTSIDMDGWQARNPGVDAGEASSICLAERHPNSLLILDDRNGRREAHNRGIRTVGVLSVILRAKQVGLISAGLPVAQALVAQGYFVSAGLLEQFKAMLDE